MLHLLALLLALSSRALATDPGAALAFLEAHKASYTRDLLDLVAFPSVSASLPGNHDTMQETAEWVAARLRRAGLQGVQLLDGASAPAVTGHWLHSPGKPTVLIYGHYDVQPAEAEDGLWLTHPFQPVEKEGSIWGRGASDDKGGFLGAVQAVEAYLNTSQALPVNVKFIIEGEEEMGSPNMEAFMEKHAPLLKADLAYSADGGQISETQGGLALALRGATSFEIGVRTLRSDVHSGTFGGSIANPNIVLAKLLASLHDSKGRVTIPGFYQGVQPITAEDEADEATLGFNPEEDLGTAGATAHVGEEGYTTVQRRTQRPTAEVVGMWGGFTGQGVKTIVPATAHAKIVCRLVADQDPDTVLKAAEAWVAAQDEPGATFSFKTLGFKGTPYSMPKNTPGNRVAAKVLKGLLGNDPVYFRVGGSIPVTSYFKKYLGIYTTLLAFGWPSDGIHGPNERYRHEQYALGRRAYVEALHELGSLPSSTWGGEAEEGSPLDTSKVEGGGKGPTVKDEL